MNSPPPKKKRKQIKRARFPAIFRSANSHGFQVETGQVSLFLPVVVTAKKNFFLARSFTMVEWMEYDRV